MEDRGKALLVSILSVISIILLWNYTEIVKVILTSILFIIAGCGIMVATELRE